MNGENPIVSVVIPAFKEGKTIGKVIKDIKNSIKCQTQIIVVDGYSNDGTREKVEGEKANFVIERRLGYGRAIRTGIDHVKGDIVVIIDGDGTYEPRDISKIIEPLANNEADVCLASRIRGKLLPGSMPALNLVGNKIFTGLYNLIYGQKVSDTQTGLRAITKKASEALDLEVDGMGIATSMLTKAAKRGLRIREFPTTYKPRNNHSKSKLNRLKAGIDIFNILLSG